MNDNTLGDLGKLLLLETSDPAAFRNRLASRPELAARLAEYRQAVAVAQAERAAANERERAEQADAEARERTARHASFREADPDAIAAEIEALLTNDLRRTSMGRNIAQDVNYLRQEIDLVMRWIVAFTGNEQ
jgi:hypothetical protein